MCDPPPPIIGSDRVLEYAIIDSAMKFTGRMTIYVDGKLLGPVPRLAVCEEHDGYRFLLYDCDETWDALAVSSGDSLSDVKEHAERAYAGLAGHWNASPYTREEASQFVQQQESVLVCSFCQKSAFEVEKMIVRDSGGPIICSFCIDLLHQELHS